MSHEVLAGAFHVLAATSSSSSKTSSSGSSVFLIFLVVLFGVYFLWLRPQRQKMRAQQAQRQAPEVGDEVVTSSGIIGRLVGLEEDRARVEVAPGQVLTFLRSAIGRRVEPVAGPSVAPTPRELGALDDGLDEDADLEHHDGPDRPSGNHDGHDHGDGAASGPSAQWWPAAKEEGPEQSEGTA